MLVLNVPNAVQTWTLNGPAKSLLTRKEVLAELGIGTRALDRLIIAGLFPRGVNISGGKRGVRWSGLDVACYLYLRGRLKAGPLEADELDEDEDDPASGISSVP